MISKEKGDLIMSKRKTRSRAIELVDAILVSREAHSCARKIRIFVDYMKDYDGTDKEEILKDMHKRLNRLMVYDDDFRQSYYVVDSVYTIQNLLWYFLPKSESYEEELENLLKAADKFDEMFGERAEPLVEARELDDILDYMSERFDYFWNVYQGALRLFLLPPNKGIDNSIKTLYPSYAEELVTFLFTRPKKAECGPLTKYHHIFFHLADEMLSVICDGSRDIPDEIAVLPYALGINIKDEENLDQYDNYCNKIALGFMGSWGRASGKFGMVKQKDLDIKLENLIDRLIEKCDQKWEERFREECGDELPEKILEAN